MHEYLVVAQLEWLEKEEVGLEIPGKQINIIPSY